MRAEGGFLRLNVQMGGCLVVFILLYCDEHFAVMDINDCFWFILIIINAVCPPDFSLMLLVPYRQIHSEYIRKVIHVHSSKSYPKLNSLVVDTTCSWVWFFYHNLMN